MKPNPFWSLNHFTLPVAMIDHSFQTCATGPLRPVRYRGTGNNPGGPSRPGASTDCAKSHRSKRAGHYHSRFERSKKFMISQMRRNSRAEMEENARHLSTRGLTQG